MPIISIILGGLVILYFAQRLFLAQPSANISESIVRVGKVLWVIFLFYPLNSVPVSNVIIGVICTLVIVSFIINRKNKKTMSMVSAVIFTLVLNVMKMDHFL